MQEVKKTKVEKIGSSDYWEIYLKRDRDRIELLRYNPLNYEDMEDYINNQISICDEWREAVYNWHTEESFDSRAQNYDYQYEDYFTFDSDTCDYYDEDWDDTLRETKSIDYYSLDEMVDIMMDAFDNDYYTGHFEYEDYMDRATLESLIKSYYKECEDYQEWIKEQRKPHWNAFSYYK